MNSTLVVVTPAAETNLTTLDRVKSELGITDTDSDAILTLKIGEASSDIAFRVAPSLKRETLIETLRPYPPRGGFTLTNSYPSLRLKRRPIVDIDSIVLDGGDPLVVDSSTTDFYHIDTDENWSGLIYRLSASAPIDWTFSQSAVITYTAGYLLPGETGRNLPPVLESACVELVSSYWASRGRDPTLKAEEDYGVARFEYWNGAVGASGSLPPGVMSKISAFLKTPAFA